MKDIKDIAGGSCFSENCDCKEFLVEKPGQIRCAYCDCAPSKHDDLGLGQIIQQEPAGKDDKMKFHDGSDGVKINSVVSKRKFFNDEQDQGFKVLKMESMQTSPSGRSGGNRDSALTVLENLSKALASKENNELGFKVFHIGGDSLSAKCNVCPTFISLGPFSKKVSNLEIHCQSKSRLKNAAYANPNVGDKNVLGQIPEEKYKGQFKHKGDKLTCLTCHVILSAEKGSFNILSNITQHLKSSKHTLKEKEKINCKFLTSYFKPKQVEEGKKKAHTLRL